jgi:pimeloyl-ACP methyl ester carboxylesterase
MKRMIVLLKTAAVTAIVTYLVLVVGITLFQRKLLYFPGHELDTNGLSPWKLDGQLIGWAQLVEHPKNVWLFFHGNAGQATSRTYALHCFSETDSVYILEYPGYGTRPGSPSLASINQAAEEAYRALRKTYPSIPICVASESIGSGPAAHLASLDSPPDKLVMVVPFDNLLSVAAQHMRWLPVELMLFDRWDNVKSLRGYSGKIEIFGAKNDEVIPIHHARNLAQALPSAVFHEIPGYHNDWARDNSVVIRN